LTLETSIIDPLGKLKKWKFSEMRHLKLFSSSGGYKGTRKRETKNDILKQVMKKVPKIVEVDHHSPEGLNSGPCGDGAWHIDWKLCIHSSAA